MAAARLVQFLHMDPISAVRESMLLSYNDLDGRSKQVFLDVACILRMEPWQLVRCMLDGAPGLKDTEPLLYLKGRSLVEKRIDGTLTVPDTLVDMAHYILRDKRLSPPGYMAQIYANKPHDSYHAQVRHICRSCC